VSLIRHLAGPSVYTFVFCFSLTGFVAARQRRRAA
jgi:hypothetical protein